MDLRTASIHGRNIAVVAVVGAVVDGDVVAVADDAVGDGGGGAVHDDDVADDGDELVAHDDGAQVELVAEEEG